VTLALALALLQDPLRYDCGEKINFVFEMRQTFKTVDEGEETTNIETWTFTFAEALAGGAAKLNVERALNGMIVDGQHYQIRAKPHRGTEYRSPRGDVRNRQPTSQIDPTFELRLLRIGDIEYPPIAVAKGTEWRRESKATDEGLPAAEWTYRATEIKDGRLSGTFTFTEVGVQRPLQAEGKFVASTRDGWPIELSLSAVNAYQIGDEEKLPCTYSFSLKRR
jgi:hypothetical protein